MAIIENFNRENILVGLLSAICRTQICSFIGVKPKKNDNFKSGKCLQTIDFNGVTKKSKNISTHLLLVTIGFCLVLSSAAEPYFQGFCGIDVFIWERLNSSIYAEMV